MGKSSSEYKYGFWYIFGENKELGIVDVSSSVNNDDVLTGVKKAEAEKVIKLHNNMLTELEATTNPIKAEETE